MEQFFQPDRQLADPEAGRMVDGIGDRRVGADIPTPTGDPPMRVYIIENDGITLCRAPPAAVNEGEIAVASNEELRAAQLSGKRLLALWNALLGVEKRKKVGDREALIDRLWSALDALPDPDQQSDTKRPSTMPFESISLQPMLTDAIFSYMAEIFARCRLRSMECSLGSDNDTYPRVTSAVLARSSGVIFSLKLVAAETTLQRTPDQTGGSPRRSTEQI
jgi:hypothetical protein